MTVKSMLCEEIKKTQSKPTQEKPTGLKSIRHGLLVMVLTILLVSAGLVWRPAVTEGGGEKPASLNLNHWLTSYSLSPYLSYYLDETGSLTIGMISRQDQALFHPLENSAVNFGLSDAVLWLRFELTESGAPGVWLLDMDRPLEQEMTLYFQDEAGSWEERPTCASPPCVNGMLLRRSVFPLPPLSATPKVFYLSIKTQTSLQFFPKISTPNAYWEKSKIQYLGQGLYFGLCLAMILYNLSIFIYLGDKTYLYYVMYVLFLAFYFSVTHGVAVEQVTFLSIPHIIKFDLISLGMAITIAGFFTRAFLMTARYAPWADRIILAYMGLAVLCPILTPWLEIRTILPLFSALAGLGPLVTLVPAIICLRRGFWPARFFIVAYACFTGGTVVFVSSYDGLIPLTKWTFHAFQMGSALEIVLLALALGDRIRSLRKEKEALAESQKYYKKTSILDGLTGLYNRRCYEDRIVEEVRRTQQDHTPLSLLILDVDHFKQFNDQFGHPQGDQVLVDLAKILMNNARKSDIPCRYGGEEFALILPRTDICSAGRVAERIRAEFEQKTFDMGPDGLVRVTVSIGVAELLENDSAFNLLKKADDALYASKRGGRNRISYGGESAHPPH